jgi:N-acetylmuramoyl-L-alanine amidase
LFISIHCNSTPKKPSNASGFEVFLLRPGKTEDAIAIAEFENSVINMENHPEQYEELTEENFILVTMAQAANMRFSEKISEILTSRWKSEQPTTSRGIKQAGLLVLVGASMPAILIETGFLSNYNDEKYINTENGQQKIAQTILNSISEYKKYYNELNQGK